MTCLQPPPPGLPREDTGTQDLSLLRASDPGPQQLVGTGLRVESRPVSLIRRVKTPLGWSLPHGCFPWTTCLPPSPRDGWPKPQACPGLLRTPDKKRHRHEGGPPPTPQACGQGPRDGARREGIQEALRHTDGTWPLPTGPVGPRGSGARSAAGRPCPGCGREGKGPGGLCPALPAPCLLALPAQPSRGGPPCSPPTPGCGDLRGVWHSLSP